MSSREYLLGRLCAEQESLISWDRLADECRSDESRRHKIANGLPASPGYIKCSATSKRRSRKSFPSLRNS